MHEVNVALDPDNEHSLYWRDRGTSQGESCHRLINSMVAMIGRQSAELSDAKLWLRIIKYNLDKDEKLHKVQDPGKRRQWYWFLKEALHLKCPWMKCYDEYNFPPPLPEGCQEPIGILYQRYKLENKQEFSDLIGSLVDDKHPPDSPAAAAAASPPVYPVIVPPIVASPNKRTSSGSVKSKVYGSQGIWSDRKSMSAQKVSLTNRYLDEGKKLTPKQERVFGLAINDAFEHYGLESRTDNVAEHVAAYFNQAHVKAFNDKPNSTGLMGLMRQPHATALLKAKGIQLQINRLTNAPEAVKRGLTKHKVPQLTYKDCIKWCKALGVPTKKTKPEMVADLEKLFDGKPANHHINP